jgi:hypothetical protein
MTRQFAEKLGRFEGAQLQLCHKNCNITSALAAEEDLSSYRELFSASCRVIRTARRFQALATSLLLGFSSALAAQVVAPPPPPPPPEVQAAPPPSGTAEQASHLSGPASFVISGIVISATTGTPLDRAEVTLSAVGQRGAPIAESVTTENGRFRFDHLQAGKYRLEASRRGYIAAGYQDHDGFYTGIVTGANLNTEGLRLELLPTAIIGGDITDESGEPIGGAQVHLFRQDQRNGESKIVGAGNDIADETGGYEFTRLRAGTYFVSVAASPWFAFHPGPKTDDSGNALPADQQPRSPLDVAYSTTFYENAIDSDSATALSVNAGDHVEANLSLHAVPAINIQIRLQQPGENRGIPMPQLVQDVFGTEEYQQATQFMTTAKNGAVVANLSGIAPGHYMLRQFGQQGEGNRLASVDLTNDQVVDFAAASAGGVDVSGKLAMISGEKLPDRATAGLTPASGGSPVNPVRIEPDGTFQLHSIAPGAYDFQVHAPGPALAIAQIAVAGAQSQGNRITVASEPVMIAATLATGTTTVTGFTNRDGKAAGGVMILLVPHNRNASPDLYRRDQSNTDGSFTLNRVVPGTYTLVAIDNGWTLEWARPDVTAPYLASGIQVQVTGQKTLALSSAVEVQQR